MKDGVVFIIINKVLFTIPSHNVKERDESIDVANRAANDLGVGYPSEGFKVVRHDVSIGDSVEKEIEKVPNNTAPIAGNVV
jgi:hypothetical protein